MRTNSDVVRNTPRISQVKNGTYKVKVIHAANGHLDDGKYTLVAFLIVTGPRQGQQFCDVFDHCPPETTLPEDKAQPLTADQRALLRMANLARAALPTASLEVGSFGARDLLGKVVMVEIQRGSGWFTTVGQELST